MLKNEILSGNVVQDCVFILSPSLLLSSHCCHFSLPDISCQSQDGVGGLWIFFSWSLGFCNGFFYCLFNHRDYAACSSSSSLYFKQIRNIKTHFFFAADKHSLRKRTRFIKKVYKKDFMTKLIGQKGIDNDMTILVRSESIVK